MLVHEIFESFQGEGFWVGMPSLFVRLYGCTVQCPYCDTPLAKKTAGNDKEHYTNYDVKRLGDDILARTCEWGQPFVTFTGGEPLDQYEELQELIWYIMSHHTTTQIQLETSGYSSNTFKGMPCGEAYARKKALQAHVWTTLSPKFHKPPHKKMLMRCNELKLLITGTEKNKDWATQLCSAVSPLTRLRFQPLIDKNADYQESLKVCFELAKEWYGRVSIQTHKFVGWQ